jgi:hypothetical protein
MSYAGFTNAGAQLGLQTLILKPAKRGFANFLLSDGTTIVGKTVDTVLFEADITIEETHSDQMEITEHPIEQGANITDHAFKRPAEVTLKLGWSNSPIVSSSLVNAALGAAATASPVGNALAGAVGAAQAVAGFYDQNSQNSSQKESPSNKAYGDLLFFQAERAIFDIYTGRRKYTNMMIRSLSVSNDWRNENSLFITVECRQVILVNTHIVTFEKSVQKDKKATTSPKRQGSKTLK